MTPDQWFDIIDEVQSLWGKSQKWANAEGLVNRVNAVSHAAAKRVVEDLMMGGEPYAPPPAMVIARALGGDIATEHVVDQLADAHCDEIGHLWATVNGTPIRCARCHTDWTPEPVEDPIAERIAR